MARIALLFHSFQVGGIARSNIRLAREFLRCGHQVDLLVGTRKGELYAEKPGEAREFVLKRGGKWGTALSVAKMSEGSLSGRLRLAHEVAASSGKTRYGASIARYLETCEPDVLFARTAPLIVSALVGRYRADTTTTVIGSEHNRLAVNQDATDRTEWRYGLQPRVLRPFYEKCDTLIAVSEGIRQEILDATGMNGAKVHTVHNPVVDETILEQAAGAVPHPWLSDPAVPVIVTVGKVNPQKDHKTLLRAFGLVLKHRDARLIVVGGTRDNEASITYRKEVEAEARSLGVIDQIHFAGHQNNPFAYLRHASLFVLSSLWEGFGNVLVEALACGCPVVSTDCVSGPREILEGGRYGALVPVGDPTQMAEAILVALEEKRSPQDLMDRANAFSVRGVAERNLALAGL
ncbi:glycosyltransferase [Aquibaculum arenosum]|uniref:Glycosyltransferase n=1 Tax=Aquibaculum arenosum TaxID=3032591 RepID=A0ABT5YHQ5_9PROT|nr:glycosyltransferase [Fodinicurvata sp. CAU 1616]MDF2094361.1 glycosyltransferase [Fodinicurvata sp. CAU 1616]